MPASLKLGAAALLLCALSGTPLHASAADATTHDDSLQAQFLLGGMALQNGDVDAAIAIFSDLSRKTSSPRIQLELARALFLARRFEESKQLFEQVAARADVPWNVRQNIRLYLAEIDITLGFVDFAFSFISDSNPRNFTDASEIKIAGQVLKVIPPPDNREVRGIRYEMRSGLALSGDRRTLGFIDLSFTDFEQNSFDRWSADARLLHDFQALSKLRGMAGLELSVLDGDKQYDFPYIGLLYRADPIDRFRLFHEFKAGRLHVPGGEHLDANQYLVSTGFTRLLRGQALLRGDISLETSRAREQPYSYTGGSIGLEVDLPIGRWGLKPLIAYGKRDYRASEPFFDEKREDLRKRFGVILSHREMRFGRFEPELSIVYDRNDSSIDFYTYDKLSVAFSLQE